MVYSYSIWWAEGNTQDLPSWKVKDNAKDAKSEILIPLLQARKFKQVYVLVWWLTFISPLKSPCLDSKYMIILSRI